ncbi:MAG: hypothetical protein DRP37_07575 [Thermodesulfobacteriota bacterium]|nr:MAG: hypothetical protein DRP37_07575 [Thermodesulfobacteriota bacterium]
MAVLLVQARYWKKGFSYLVLLAFVLAPFLALATEPAGNIHIGQLDIHPSLSVQEEYNDNIYNEDKGETGAAITTISPGIAFQLPLQKHLLNMDCRAEFIEPSRHQNYEADNYFANIMLDLDFNRLNVQIGDNFARDSVAPDSENDIRNDYYQNRFFLDTSYKLADRYKIKGFYRNELRDFNRFHKQEQSDPELDDYTKNEVGFNLFYRFLPLTSALVEYGYTNINNDDMGLPSTDSDTQRLWLGLTWEATSKITGTIKGGYTYRNYDGDTDDFDGFGMKGDLTYKFTSYTNIGLNGFRKPVDTSVTQEDAVYGTYYVSTGGTLSVDHRLTHKITASAHVSYTNDHYEEKGKAGREAGKRRDDDRYGIGVGVNYRIQDWLGCNISYNYVDNDSNFDNEEYQTNIIASKISLSF